MSKIIKCNFCDKELNNNEYLITKSKIACKNCYNHIKEEVFNYNLLINQYKEIFKKPNLPSKEAVRIKTLKDKGYSYTEIMFTINYIYNILKKDIVGGSLGLLPYYIEKAINYANTNNVDLTVIPKTDYFKIKYSKEATLLEKKTKRLENLIKRKENTQVTYINESQLEDYLVENFNIIEEGFRFVERQYAVRNGIVDLFGYDINGIPCLIELKVDKNCKRIERQCKEYPEQFNEFRMITIAPNYPTEVFTVLNSLGYVEMFTYDIELGNEICPIKNLTLHKIN